MNRQQATDWSVHLAIAFAAAFALATVFGGHFGEALLPSFRAVLRWLCREYWIAGLDLIEERGESRFIALAVTLPGMQVAGRGVAPGGPVSSMTLLGHALQYPVVMFTVLWSWPALSLIRGIAMSLFALPMLWLAECLDVPVVLGGNIRAAVAEQVAPWTVASSPLVQWIDFLGGGGRMLLALGAAFATIALFRFLEAGSRAVATLVRTH
jgi:hypothetical protein